MYKFRIKVSSIFDLTTGTSTHIQVWIYLDGDINTGHWLVATDGKLC